MHRARAVLAAALTACALGSCAAQTTTATDPQATTPSATPEPTPSVEAEPTPQPVPLAPDLERLANAFVRYARGDADTFPHWQSVSMSLGGQTVQAVDDVHAALANAEIWQICAADQQGYAAASCPVDLLDPIRESVVNEMSLVLETELGDVTCAPTLSGPPPSGRLVVIRPPQEWRTCASDFALVLVADDEGLLRHVDLTLSNP